MRSKKKSESCLQFHQDGRIVRLAARVWEMDPRPNPWSKTVETMDEQEIICKAYRQYPQIRKFEYNDLVLVVMMKMPRPRSL